MSAVQVVFAVITPVTSTIGLLGIAAVVITIDASEEVSPPLSTEVNMNATLSPSLEVAGIVYLNSYLPEVTIPSKTTSGVEASTKPFFLILIKDSPPVASALTVAVSCAPGAPLSVLTETDITGGNTTSSFLQDNTPREKIANSARLSQLPDKRFFRLFFIKLSI